MAIFDYATCHNINTYKLNNDNEWLRSRFQENFNFHEK